MAVERHEGELTIRRNKIKQNTGLDGVVKIGLASATS